MTTPPTTLRVSRYCFAVIYRDDAVEVELLATDALHACDEIDRLLGESLRPGWTEIVLICEPTA